MRRFVLIRRIFGVMLFLTGCALVVLFFYLLGQPHADQGGGAIVLLLLAGGSLFVGVKWMRGEVAGDPVKTDDFVFGKHEPPRQNVDCPICGKPVDVRNFKTDDNGNRCHWDCLGDGKVSTARVAIGVTDFPLRSCSDTSGEPLTTPAFAEPTMPSSDVVGASLRTQSPQLPVWSDGKSTFVVRGATFPARCIKCNGTSEIKTFTTTLYWFDPRLWFLLILNWLGIVIIIYYLLKRTAKVRMSVCRACRRRRLTNIFVALLIFGLSIASIALCIYFNDSRNLCVGLGIVSGCAFVASLIYSPIYVPYCAAIRIDGDIVTVRGPGQAFRGSLDAGTTPPRPRRQKFENATQGDIALSIFLPGWGVIIGIIALLKGEKQRAVTMIGIGIVVLFIGGFILLANHR
jgi:hypothetical protein